MQTTHKYDHECTSIKSFIERHGIRFECRRVETRPDGLMPEDNPHETIVPASISAESLEQEYLAGRATLPVNHINHREFVYESIRYFVGHDSSCKPPKDIVYRAISIGQMRHFRCRIGADTPWSKAKDSASFSFYFSQGSAHTSDPTLAEVLDCLASDASGYEQAKNHLVSEFDYWANEDGYDTDSRQAEKTFKAIKRQSEQLKRTLGQAAYDELLNDTERL